MHKEKLYKDICDSRNDVNKLWKIVKKHKCTFVKNNISVLDWQNYFSELLVESVNMCNEFSDIIKNSMNVHDSECENCNTNFPEFLNKEISKDEIISVIKSLPNNKAPGLDGLGIEFFKNTTGLVVPCLELLFNKMLQLKYFLESWCNAMLVPIYKKGDVNNVNNYRGISLLNVLSKIFTKILNNRLVEWVESENLLFQEQKGFRRGQSTIDQVFILNTMIQKYLLLLCGLC